MIGSADIKDVVYEINCEDLPDAGVNRTVQNSLDITYVVVFYQSHCSPSEYSGPEY